MTEGERLIEEGMKLGLAEGRAEGRAATLLKLMSLRFGVPTPEVEARVRAASVEDHERWAEAVLTAPTLDALLAVGSDHA